MIIKSSHFVRLPESDKKLVRTELFPIQKDKGNTFVVMRFLGNADIVRTQIADLLSERLSILARQLEEPGNIPRRFEQFLQTVNTDIAEIVSTHHAIPLSDVHIVLGVQYGQQLYMSGIGTLHAIFMNRTAKQRYVIYELDQQFQHGQDQTWEKLFMTVLDGELHPGDIFYSANRVSKREISLAELQDILVTLPPSGALKRISQHLHLQTAYSAICFQVKEPTTGGPPKKVNPIHSVEHLGNTKSDTEKILGEKEPDVGRFLTRITKPLLKRLSAPGTSGIMSILKRILSLLIRALTFLLTYTILGLTWLGKGLLATARNIRPLFHKGKSLVKDGPTVKERTQSLIDRFNALPQATKVGSLAAIAVIAVLITGSQIYSGIQSRQQERAAEEEIVRRIEEKQTDAEARLIYDEQEQARSLIEEAFALLETLPASTDQETIQNIRSNLQTILLDIQGIEPVNPSSLAEINGESTIASLSYLPDTNRYVILSQDNQLFGYSPIDNAFTPIETTAGSVDTPILTTQESSDTLLIVDQQKQLIRGSANSGTLLPIVSGTNDLASVEDLTVYNDTLYVLSADAEQIIRMRARGDGYEAGTPWVSSSNTPLNDATSIAIDGDVYILTSTDIVKFRSGREQSFTYDRIDPSLSEPTRIWTDTSSAYLYILDPAESRVIVLTKTGDVVTQYQNELLQTATDMIVEEENNRILFTTQRTLYSFPTPHLLQ